MCVARPDVTQRIPNSSIEWFVIGTIETFFWPRSVEFMLPGPAPKGGIGQWFLFRNTILLFYLEQLTISCFQGPAVPTMTGAHDFTTLLLACFG